MPWVALRGALNCSRQPLTYTDRTLGGQRTRCAQEFTSSPLCSPLPTQGRLGSRGPWEGSHTSDFPWTLTCRPAASFSSLWVKRPKVMSGGEEEGKNWGANHLIHFQRKCCRKVFSNLWGSPPLELSCLHGPCSLSAPGPEIGKPNPSSTHPPRFFQEKGLPSTRVAVGE